MLSMEFSDPVSDALLHLSSVPLRERSGSTTPSSAFSGTDGAPSSRASSEGNWIDLVDQRLEHGRWEEAESEKTECLVEASIEKGQGSVILDNGVTRDAKVQRRSTEEDSPHQIPIEKPRVTSGGETPLTRPRTSLLRRHHLPLTLLLSVTLASYTSSPYTLIPLAALGITSFVRILIRAISANPIIRSIALSHIAWKASTFRMQYSILFIVLFTTLVAIRPLIKSPTAALTPTKDRNPLAHSLTCSNTGELWTGYQFVKGVIRTLFITLIMVASALPLCCIYSIWDHGEPVFLAVLSLALFALSQVVAEISQEILRPSVVDGGGDMDHDSGEDDPLDNIDDLGLDHRNSSGTPLSNRSCSRSCDSIGTSSSTRLPIIMTMVGLILQSVVYAAQGIAACAWLLLWGELDAHRVVISHLAPTLIGVPGRSWESTQDNQRLNTTSVDYRISAMNLAASTTTSTRSVQIKSIKRTPPGPLTLPVEIILMILEPFIPQSQSRQELVLVINLSRVCRYWRRIIISTPIFWTHVCLDPDYHERDVSPTHYLACLELQLQRTGTKLLDVSCYIVSDIQPELSNIMRKYAPLERWRTLSLCLITNGVSSTGMPSRRSPLISMYEDGAFTQLEEMTLYGSGALTPDLIDLVERTALRLRRFTAGMGYSPILRSSFPKTLRRIEIRATGESGSP